MITKRYYINKTGTEPFRYHFEEYEYKGGVWQDTLVGGWFKTIDDVYAQAGWDLLLYLVDNGIAVCNCTVIEDGFYIKIAHINYDRSVIIYENMPPAVEQKIRAFAADYDFANISTGIPNSSITTPPPISAELIRVTYQLRNRPERDNAQKSF